MVKMAFPWMAIDGRVWAWRAAACLLVLTLPGCSILWPAPASETPVPAAGSPPAVAKPSTPSAASNNMPARTGPLSSVVVLLDQEMMQTALETYVGFALSRQRKDVAAFTTGLSTELKNELDSAKVATEVHILNFSDTASRAKVRLQNRPTLVIRMVSFAKPPGSKSTPLLAPIGTNPSSAARTTPQGTATAGITRGGSTAASSNKSPATASAASNSSQRPPFIDGETEWSAQLSESVGTNAYSTTWRTQIDDIYLGPHRCKNYEVCGRQVGRILLTQMRRDGLMR